jgi:pimeloyl-ACP methyl ester carboxylesterase
MWRARRRRHVEVAFSSGDAVLRGTLSVPAGEGPHPAVVLIHGGTPEDRDGNSDRRLGGMVTSRRPELKELARSLVSAGIAVLRYDKRGVGRSGGDYLRRTQQDLVDDVLAGADLLRGWPGIDHSMIGLVGHSEGSTVGIRAAVTDRRIGALALLAGAADNIADLARWHSRQAAWRSGDPSHIDDLEVALASVDRGAEQFTWFGGQHESGAWLREWRELDLLPILRQVTCPVLLFHGEKDWHVPWQSSLGMAQELTAAGNPDVTLQLFSNIDHLLRFEPGLSSPQRYVEEPDRPLDPLVLRSINAWARRVLIERAPPIERRFGQQLLDLSAEPSRTHGPG